jgi:hypothetical protein
MHVSVEKVTISTRQFLKREKSEKLKADQSIQSGCRREIWLQEWVV